MTLTVKTEEKLADSPKRIRKKYVIFYMHSNGSEIIQCNASMRSNSYMRGILRDFDTKEKVRATNAVRMCVRTIY